MRRKVGAGPRSSCARREYRHPGFAAASAENPLFPSPFPQLTAPSCAGTEILVASRASIASDYAGAGGEGDLGVERGLEGRR